MTGERSELSNNTQLVSRGFLRVPLPLWYDSKCKIWMKHETVVIAHPDREPHLLVTVGDHTYWEPIHFVNTRGPNET